MIDYIKNKDFFDPLEAIQAPIHVIGCGAIGSTIIEMLTRMGVATIHIWDFDRVSAHNLANQMYFEDQIGLHKTDAIKDIMRQINPDIKIKAHEAYTNEILAGYIFLCVDNIEVRKTIVQNNQFNPNIKAFFDFRMRLTDAQHYAASNEQKSITALLATMNFTSEEAKAATPVNACGTSLNIINTVRLIVSVGLSNFINYIKKGELRPMLLIDAFSYLID